MTDQLPISFPVSFWFAFIILTILYILFLIWFTKDRFSPVPDSTFLYKQRLDRLTQDVGHLIVDDLSIETGDEFLGKGSDGFVFKGYVLANVRGRFKEKVPAAVKASVPTPSSAVRLLEEASRLSRLEHAHTVRLLAVAGSPLRPVLALEWLPGGSLQNYFRTFIRGVEDEQDRPTVLLKDILNIIYQVATAVRHIHETFDISGREIVHGDLATRNVLMDRRDLRGVNVKLGDFGLPEGARPLAWLPPEIICAHHSTPKQTPEGDIWMFGVFMWECLTLGATPHFQRSVEEIQRSLRLPDRGLDCPNSCPLDVWTAVLECLSEAHRRPRCAGPEDGNHSLVFRLRTLRDQHGSSTHPVFAKENISGCTCPEHRCKGTAVMLVD